MKKLMTCRICVAAAFIAGAVFTADAKYEGSYINAITTEYVSPHFDWAENLRGGPVKAYIITFSENARPVVELMQRMSLDAKTVTTMGRDKYGSTDTYTTPVEGVTPSEKKNELISKFSTDSEVVILHDYLFKALPSELQVRIMRYVKDGGGLLITGTVPWMAPAQMMPAKFLAAPLPDIVKEFNLATPSSRKFSAYQYGKGRIALLTASPDKNNPDDVGQWWTNHESSQAPFINAVLWAAGRKSDVRISENPKPVFDKAVMSAVNEIRNKSENKDREINLYAVPFGTRSMLFNAEGRGMQKFAYRIRNNDNKTIFSGETTAKLDGLTPVAIKIPQLESGRFVLDVQALESAESLLGIPLGKDTVKAIACYPFAVASPLSDVSIKIGDDAVYEGKPFSVQLITGERMAEDAVVDISLSDSPYGRVWYRSSVKFPKSSNNLNVTLKDYYVPTRAGVLSMTIKDQKDEPLASVKKVIFFPNYELDTFLEFGDFPKDPLMAPQMVDSGNRWRNGLWGGKTATILNQRVLPWATNIQIMRGKDGAVTYPWMTGNKDPNFIYNRLNGDLNPYQPEVREYWRDKAMKGGNLPESRKYGAVIYNLGDECGFDYNSGFGPSDRKYFTEFLQKHYGSLENMNKAWGSSYKSFEEVPHLELEDAKNRGEYTLWFAHRQYMERMYADLFHYVAVEICKQNPHAKVGAEGSSPGDLELTISKLKFWGPYQDKVEGELLRSVGGDRVRTFWWGGYIGMQGGRNDYPLPLWNNLLRGTYDGHMWFMCLPGGSMSYLGSDYSFAGYYKNMLPYMNELTNGLGQLLVTTPFANKDIVLYHSHSSEAAAQLDARFSGAGMSDQLIDYFYETGLNFDFMTKNNPERIKTAKIVFLTGACALGDKEITTIRDYVKNGGTVVAALNPGIANEYLKINSENPMKDLFGNAVFENIQPPAPRVAEINTELSGQKIHFESDRLVSTPGMEFFQVRKYGKGTAVLLNFSLASAFNSQKSPGMFNDMIAAILRSAGVSFPVQVKSDFPMNMRSVRIRSGKGFELIGMLSLLQDKGQNAVVTLPSEKYVYEPFHGYIGKTKDIKVHFDIPFKIYSAFETLQAEPKLSLSAGSVEAGTAVILDMKGNRPDGVFFMRMYDEKGNVVPLRDQVIELRKGTSIPIRFAYNDPKGRYAIVVTDVATGLKNTVSVNLK